MLVSTEHFFKILADKTRLHILMLLQDKHELCVCELTYALDLIQPKISRHIALLKEFGLIEGRKEGKWVYYQIAQSSPQWQLKILKDVNKSGAQEWRGAIARLHKLSETNQQSALCCN